MSFKDALKNSKKKGKKKPMKKRGKKKPFDEMEDKQGGKPNPFMKFGKE